MDAILVKRAMAINTLSPRDCSDSSPLWPFHSHLLPPPNVGDLIYDDLEVDVGRRVTATIGLAMVLCVYYKVSKQHVCPLRACRLVGLIPGMMKATPLPLGQIRLPSLRPARRITAAFRTSSWPPPALSTPLTSASRLPAPSTARNRLYSTNSRSPGQHDVRVQNSIQSISKNDDSNGHASSSVGDEEQPSRRPYVRTGSVFPISSHPLFDAALTSIVGLGIGKWPFLG
ncbi:hypothetical protein EDC04DRAFT_844227 [Pisolithus marmoratus]|nr:hypothetical protein EDC04DRAFT_844227 [Pisolithus marmoratus]